MYGYPKTRHVWAPSRGAGFNALAYPDCGAWWRADSIVIPEGSDNAITLLPDLSGNNVDLVEFSTSETRFRPIYIANGWRGHPTLSFIAAQMRTTAFSFGANDRTMLMVLHSNGGNNLYNNEQNLIFCVGGGGSYTAISYQWRAARQGVHVWSSEAYVDIPPITAQPYVMILTYDHAAQYIYMYINGALIFTWNIGLNATPALVTVGAWLANGYWGSWNFYEAALYDGYCMDAATASDVSNQLAAYYRF